jgi:CelD/BcsL family acetyltransferase involved in cellulose biosynthesis
LHAAAEGLEPEEALLEPLIGARTRALLIVHRLGWPAHAGRWRRWCDARGLLLLEDCRESWLAVDGGVPVGALGDLSLFAFGNVLPLPDVCAAVVRGNLLMEAEPREDRQWPAPSTPPLLRRLAEPAVARRRRAHFRSLAAALDGRLAPRFADMPDGASPLVFPLVVRDPADAIARLSAAGVQSRPLAGRLHPLAISAGAARITGDAGDGEVALPVHQELAPDDLDRIADAAGSLRRDAPSRPREELSVETLGSIDALRGEWQELGLRTGNLFATWEWQSTWWRHFGGHRTPAAVALRDRRGTLVGLLPLYRATPGPLALLRFIGHGAGDRLGPICAAADRLRVARGFRSALRARRFGTAVVLGEQLPEDEGWSAALGARVLTREGSPGARIETRDWDVFLAARSANLRQQVRRKERKLAREHDLRFRLVEEPEQLAPALDALFALHRARWSTADGTHFARTEAFHRDFAAQALQRGWLRLWVLELDGRPAAAWQGFRFGGADWYYQMGRDPAAETLSVGFVLLAHTIRDAVESGVGEYRFLRGGESYKGRFATGDSGLETIVLASGDVGAAAMAAAQVGGRLPAARRLVAAGA